MMANPSIRELAIQRLGSLIALEIMRGRDPKPLEWAVEALSRMGDPD
jgi:hypothetical protein